MTVPTRYLATLAVLVATLAAAIVADRHRDALAVGWCAELCGPSGASDAYYYRGEDEVCARVLRREDAMDLVDAALRERGWTLVGEVTP